MPYFRSISRATLISALPQTTTFSLAWCAQVICSNVASPVIRERTRIPDRASSGSTNQRSPAMLYSPIRLISVCVMTGVSPVPITCSSRTSPAMRFPRFLGPTNPGAFTGITRMSSSSSARLHTASMSSPVIPLTHVAYTKIAFGLTASISPPDGVQAAFLPTRR